MENYRVGKKFPDKLNLQYFNYGKGILNKYIIILLLRLSQNKICVYISICPPLAFTTLSSLPLKLSTETQSFSCGILTQAFFRNTFKLSMVLRVLA